MLNICRCIKNIDLMNSLIYCVIKHEIKKCFLLKNELGTFGVFSFAGSYHKNYAVIF